MIKEEFVNLNKTARKEELLAYIICKDYIFANKECLIGDSIKSNCPDIYAKDFSVGAEVVICECAETLARIQNKKLGNAFTKSYLNKNKKSLYIKPNNLNKEYQQYISEKDEYYYQFESVVADKINNEKNNHYKACKELNLIVMSCFKNKPYLNINELFEFCELLMKMNNSGYNAIYIVLGDKTLMIDKEFNKKVLSDLNNTLKEEYEK